MKWCTCSSIKGTNGVRVSGASVACSSASIIGGDETPMPMLDMASSTDVAELPLQLISRCMNPSPGARVGDFLGSGGLRAGPSGLPRCLPLLATLALLALDGLVSWLGFLPFTPSTQKLTPPVGPLVPDDPKGGEADRAGCKRR